METLLTILLLIANGQYRPVEKIKYPSQGKVDMVYRPDDSQYQTNEATVSYYDQSACGNKEYGTTCKTANGEIFNENEKTVAHRSIKFGTRIEFKYGDNHVICRVSDRGPFIDGREFDLSLGCFRELSDISKGIIKVEYELK